MFLEISQNSQENVCARVSFLIKLQRPATLLKKILRHRCFPVNFVKFLRTTFSQNTSGRLLLFYWKLPENRLVKLEYPFTKKEYHHKLFHEKLSKISRGARCKTCLKLTIKTLEPRQWRYFGVFFVNLEHILIILRIVLVFPLLTLNK